MLKDALVFSIFNPKFLFGQIWAWKVKVVRFVWKLAYIVSGGCWFLFQHLFSEFRTKNPFLVKIGPKKSNLSILPKNWHTWYLEDADSYSKISFLNFKTKIHLTGDHQGCSPLSKCESLYCKIRIIVYMLNGRLIM